MLFDVWYGLKEGFPGSSTGKECACNAGDSDSWVRKIPWRRYRLSTPVFLGFPGGLDNKESACNVKDPGLIPGLERSPREGNGPVFLLGKSHAQRSLVGYSPRGSQRVGHDWAHTHKASYCNYDSNCIQSVGILSFYFDFL